MREDARRLPWLTLLAIVVLPACGVSRGFIYPAPEDAPPALRAPFERVEGVARDGAQVNVYLLPPPDDRAHVVVVFHGNGETMENRAPMALFLRKLGLGVALVEYRGYGLSRDAPAPGERGLYMDGAAALEALTARGVRPERIVLMGISLGTGVAAQMAACGAAHAVVLVSPFTSMVEEAHHVVSWVPKGWFVPDRYDTLAKAPSIRMPALVVHGDLDAVVPLAMGCEVAGAIPGAQLLVVHGGHHNDLLRPLRGQALEQIAEFARR